MGRVVLAAQCHDVPEIVVREIEQLAQLRVGGMSLEIAVQKQVELEQPAPAFPFQTVEFDAQTARLTSNSLMWLIAFVGLRPFGQTSTQFMIVWQRNSR